MQICTICSHPEYTNMIQELKAGTPRTRVATKYKVDYTSLGRCWQEHRPHDHEYDVSSAIKRTQKLLDKELKKKSDQNRLLVKDLEGRLSSLRAEQRQLRAIKKEEGHGHLDGDAPLTIQALDDMIANYKFSDIDGDADIQNIGHVLRFKVPKELCKQICKEIEALIEQSLRCASNPVHVQTEVN